MIEIDLGNEMWLLRGVDPATLREADINAHSMPAEKFDRLVENIKARGTLESLPYTVQPKGQGQIAIVSGHHRTRAARRAGLNAIDVLCDRSEMSRSQVLAKQLAHNALVGFDDTDTLKAILAQIDNLTDLLATGLPAEFFPTAEADAVQLFAPHADFLWQYVAMTFLPHQMENVKTLVERLNQPHDMVMVGREEQFKSFVQAIAKYSRLRDIRSAGTAIALLTEIALRESVVLEAAAEEKAAAETLAEPAKKAPTKRKRDAA